MPQSPFYAKGMIEEEKCGENKEESWGVPQIKNNQLNVQHAPEYRDTPEFHDKNSDINDISFDNQPRDMFNNPC